MRVGTVMMFVAVLAIAANGFAQRGEDLKVGDPAPGIDVEGWVGSEGTTITPKGVYVVAFWESVTTGGKNIARINRFLDLFGHKGLEVIVVTDDDMDSLLSWSQRQGNLKFHIAADRRNGTQRAWVRRSGFRELPVGFIVGKGKIMHVGQAGDEDFENILIQVLTGRFDPQLQEQAQPKLNEARRARKVHNWRMATKAYDEVIGLDSQVFTVIALERLEMLYVDMDQKDAAYEYAENVLIGKLFVKDAGALRLLAVAIIEDPDYDHSKRELDIALAAAKRSLELDGPRNPDALAANAMVHARRNEYNEAIDLQTQAYFLAIPKEKPTHKRLLASYREAAARGSASGP